MMLHRTANASSCCSCSSAARAACGRRCAAPAAAAQRRRLMLAAAQDSDAPAAASTAAATAAQEPASPSSSSLDGASSSSSSSRDGTSQRRVPRQADSTDAVASFLSRRFGLAGGLAWLGVLAVGTLGEQVKTRMEVAAEQAGTRDVAGAAEVVLPSGVAFRELRLGGGQTPVKGYLVVVDYIGRANGVEFENTKARGKPIVYLFGSRPFTGGMCPGVEEAMRSMRAGGKRIIRVPAAAGFGERGAVVRPTEHAPDKQGVVPPGAELEYELELLRVSIPPS